MAIALKSDNTTLLTQKISSNASHNNSTPQMIATYPEFKENEIIEAQTENLIAVAADHASDKAAQTSTIIMTDTNTQTDIINT